VISSRMRLCLRIGGPRPDVGPRENLPSLAFLAITPLSRSRPRYCPQPGSHDLVRKSAPRSFFILCVIYPIRPARPGRLAFFYEMLPLVSRAPPSLPLVGPLAAVGASEMTCSAKRAGVTWATL